MRIAFYTLGCKVNQYETDALKQQFAQAGFQVVEPEEDADVYVVNSCTVTAEGDRKSRQALRRFRRRSPGAVMCLTGCYPQAFPELAGTLPEADIITGSRDRAQLLRLVQERLQGGLRQVSITPHASGEPFEALRADTSSRTRAFLKIEDGCDRFCSYCIIPMARGPVRSQSLAALGEQLEALAAAGYREVVLVGINLSSYGRDQGLRLLDAITLACGTPGIRRVRLGSLEPELLTNEDIAAMAALPALCPQFHLSLQSGCDATLRRMRRHYDTAEFRRIAGELCLGFPGCALTTDIMVGFPGETEAEFEASLAFVEEIAFAKVHVFAYSPRPGSKAAEMPDQIPGPEKSRRSEAMAAVAAKTRRAFLLAQAGSAPTVLVEERLPDGMWEGYSENYTPIRFREEPAMGAVCPGELRAVRVTEAGEDFCIGTLLP